MNKNKLTPFYWCMLENFPFIESVFDAIDNYQLLCKIVEYVNKTATKTNELGVKVEELNNWFVNLDVQDEINNKLDEMAQDGTLQEIITNYVNLKSLLCYNNISELKNADNLINGSFAQTLGYYTVNDGGESLYKIREIKNTDVIDEMYIVALQDENLVAELIYDEINVKQLGAKGDGLTDETLIFKKALSQENTVVIIPDGKYLISDMVYMAKNVKVIGNKATLKVNTKTNILGINIYNNIKDLNFELPYGYDKEVVEISYRTLDEHTPAINHDLNIHINNLTFFFDPAINDLEYKKGHAFLISADSTIENNKFNSDGFFGVYIKDIYVKGACESVIKQYANKTAGDWITGCYYEDFNINSAPFYGFLGTKDSNDLGNLNYWDGEEIYFTNWQMQAGNSKNMFFFSWGFKTLINIQPWDWAYAISSDYKPINFLYREEKRPSYIDKLLGNMWDVIQIENIPSESEYWAYVPNILNHYINKGNNLLSTGEHNRGKMIQLTTNTTQEIVAGSRNKVNFPVEVINDARSVGFSHSNNTVKILKGIHRILLHCKLNFWFSSGESITYYVTIKKANDQNPDVKTGNIYGQKEYLEFTEILQVEEGDEIEIKLYTANNNFTINALNEVFNELTIVSLG